MISVVLPTYNRARCLSRAINSVLNQTYSDFELIVVDDGSTDNTRELVEGYSDPRIRYLYQENAGANAARNRGIEEARGEYIAFHDSDDEWREDKLDVQLRALKEHNVDIVFCGFIRKTEGEEGAEPFPPEALKPKGFATVCDILPGNICTTATIFLKRECLIEDRFDETMPRLQEWELLLRLFPKWRVFYVDDYLATVYLQKDSISMNNEAYLEALKRINWMVGSWYKQEYMQSRNLRKQLDEMVSSKSWRITAPLRAFMRLFRGKDQVS